MIKNTGGNKITSKVVNKEENVQDECYINKTHKIKNLCDYRNNCNIRVDAKNPLVNYRANYVKS